MPTKSHHSHHSRRSRHGRHSCRGGARSRRSRKGAFERVSRKKARPVASKKSKPNASKRPHDSKHSATMSDLQKKARAKGIPFGGLSKTQLLEKLAAY